MTWFPGPGGHPSQSRLSQGARHEPFSPRIPGFILERPIILGAVLATFGIGTSVVMIKTMHRWPAWMIVPSMGLAVLAMAATVIGLVILTILALQPLIEGKEDLGWDAEPLASMGIPLGLQRKCEKLGYWTCEALSEAIAKGLFPWTDLDYDERQQIHRAVQFWRATTGAGA